MSVHNAKKENAAIKRQFSASVMSDTKWRKVFSVIAEPDLGVDNIILKFVSSNEQHTIRTPTTASLYPPRPYIDIFHFGDPFSFRSIEWLEIPRKTSRDLEEVRSKLAELGQFQIEETTHGFRIIGHVRGHRGE